MPQIISHQVPDASGSGSCNIHLTWNLPSNIAPDDVSHFTVHINGTHMANERRNANESSILTSYRLCSCGSHNVNISAVNRCGSSGQTLSILSIVENQLSIPQFPVQCQNNRNILYECQGKDNMIVFMDV